MHSFILLFLFFLLAPTHYTQQTTGVIKGKVFDVKTGDALPFTNIMIKGTTHGTASDQGGNFVLPGLSAGTYTLVVSLVGHVTKEIPNVAVTTGDTVTKTIFLDDEHIRLGTVDVYAASFRKERITESPAAVSVFEANDIVREGIHGQLPKILETQPGVDIAQSGLYDFNINTRGFNSSLTRRLLVLLDGRDLAIVLLGAQEWNGLSIPLEDLGRLELVRGPGSALYGANAFNGVINIVSLPPKEILGTKASLSLGELNSWRGDIRHAETNGPLSYKVNIGRFQGETWSVSRDTFRFEYSGFNPFLNKEVIPINTGKVVSTYGSARIDYDFNNGGVSTVEGGMAQVENEIYITGIGRVQVNRAQKPWGRMSYSDDKFNVQVWTAGRNSVDPQYSLSTGLPLDEHSSTFQGDIQYHFSAFEKRLFVVTGFSQRYQTLDTRGTLLENTHNDNTTGVYGQIEYQIDDNFKEIVAARWDRSTLHPSQFSPKTALVWMPSTNHTFRLTYNKAFQSPNYVELFLHVLHPSANLAYFGNDNLTVESIHGYEFGYKGVFGHSLFLTADFYYNDLKDFITDLAPAVNPKYPGQVFVGGANRTIWSYANAGRVAEKGIEFAINHYISDEWILDANYSLFDFTILEKNPNDILLPNAPSFKLNGGITYMNKNKYTASLKVKYVPSYDWAAGIYQGKILAYTIVNLSVSYQITPHLHIGVNASNLFNREHYEIFGGSLIKRRTLATLTATF